MAISPHLFRILHFRILVPDLISHRLHRVPRRYLAAANAGCWYLELTGGGCQLHVSCSLLSWWRIFPPAWQHLLFRSFPRRHWPSSVNITNRQLATPEQVSSFALAGIIVCFSLGIARRKWIHTHQIFVSLRFTYNRAIFATLRRLMPG